jgi:hypothetical protein
MHVCIKSLLYSRYRVDSCYFNWSNGTVTKRMSNSVNRKDYKGTSGRQKRDKFAKVGV